MELHHYASPIMLQLLLYNCQYGAPRISARLASVAGHFAAGERQCKSVPSREDLLGTLHGQPPARSVIENSSPDDGAVIEEYLFISITGRRGVVETGHLSVT